MLPFLLAEIAPLKRMSNALSIFVYQADVVHVRVQTVMPGLVPGIHVLIYAGKDVDGRVIGREDGASRLLPGHDESRKCVIGIIGANYSAGLACAASAARSAAARFSTIRTDQTEPS